MFLFLVDRYYYIRDPMDGNGTHNNRSDRGGRIVTSMECGSARVDRGSIDVGSICRDHRSYYIPSL